VQGAKATVTTSILNISKLTQNHSRAKKNLPSPAYDHRASFMTFDLTLVTIFSRLWYRVLLIYV